MSSDGKCILRRETKASKLRQEMVKNQRVKKPLSNVQLPRLRRKNVFHKRIDLSGETLSRRKTKVMTRKSEEAQEAASGSRLSLRNEEHEKEQGSEDKSDSSKSYVKTVNTLSIDERTAHVPLSPIESKLNLKKQRSKIPVRIQEPRGKPRKTSTMKNLKTLDEKETLKERGSEIHREKQEKLEFEESEPYIQWVSSKREVSGVTINSHGFGVLGLTPGYKMKIIAEYLKSFPDIVFIQDSIAVDDMTSILSSVSKGKYRYIFDQLNEDRENNSEFRSTTGIAWNKEKYREFPLDTSSNDDLQDYRSWIHNHRLTIVKLSSSQRVKSEHIVEDIYPSLIGVSWHGPDYSVPLKIRLEVLNEFMSFLKVLRVKNGHLPILIGGDFNTDVKSSFTDQEFLYVPYRPTSGTLIKDLKTTFAFSWDSLRVTEAGFKQYHPDVFVNPFIKIKFRGRNRIKLWAVIRIQRAFRAHSRRKKIAEEADREALIFGEKLMSGSEDPSSPNENEEEKETSDHVSVNHEIFYPQKEIYEHKDESFAVGGQDFRRKRYVELKSIYERKKDVIDQ